MKSIWPSLISHTVLALGMLTLGTVVGRVTAPVPHQHTPECAYTQDVVILNGLALDPREVGQALTRDEDARRAEAISSKLEWNTQQWKEKQKWKQ